MNERQLKRQFHDTNFWTPSEEEKENVETPMALYRLLTEDKNVLAIELLLRGHFDAYTIYPARGNWKGMPENTLIIEIYTNHAHAIQTVIEHIKKINEQESVMLQKFDIECSF